MPIFYKKKIEMHESLKRVYIKEGHLNLILLKVRILINWNNVDWNIKHHIPNNKEDGQRPKYLLVRLAYEISLKCNLDEVATNRMKLQQTETIERHHKR